MIAQEVFDLLMPTGRGTPCGDLMRCYWQPAALSEELSPDKPLPTQLFGEELILFRDGDGKPALIGRYCAHQGVDMIYGQVEPDGLRCLYHGWLFDNCGKVVLRGDWLPEQERRWDVGQPAYPCAEQGGLIFTYMAKGAPAPPPTDELFAMLRENCAVSKVHHSGNYLQSMSEAAALESGRGCFLLPNLTLLQADSPGAKSVARWYVPVDDQSHLEYRFHFVAASTTTPEPQVAAHEILFGAVQALATERQASSGGVDAKSTGKPT